MLRWYFIAIIKKYQEVKYIESGKHIAMLYRVKVTLRKVIRAWQNTIKAEKTQLLKMRSALNKNMKSAKILFDFIGKHYQNKSYYNQLDVDEFRISAYNQGRVLKKNQTVFDT